MKKHQLQSILERLTNWVLIVTGTAGGIWGIVNLFTNFQNNPLDSSILTLLGLIAVGLGLEKLISYKKIENTIENLAGGVRLEGWDEIYGAASELIHSAQSQIRGTVFNQDKWAGPSYYLDLIAKKAKAQKDAHKDFIYKVVIGISGKPTADNLKHVEFRYSIFKKYGIQSMHRMKYVNTNLGIDLLIVDDQSLIIAFPQFKSQNLRVGIKFVDQPKLVGPILTWYEEQLWMNENAYDVNECR